MKWPAVAASAVTLLLPSMGKRAPNAPRTAAVMTSSIAAMADYNERWRPQFHFTARAGWLNDPNGLVYYRGEYHLFFQHNPFGTQWGNMTWGHAVSRDLVRWRQLPNAIEPDAFGTVFSGSAVVDAANTAGFRAGRDDALVAMYTAAGGTSDGSKGQPFTQCIAYSTDRGRTWTKYAGNPVLAHVLSQNRDPKVARYAPERKWVVALYLDGDEYALFESRDLKRWTELQRFHVPGCGECPDFFEMPVAGYDTSRSARSGEERRWVFTAANGHYLVGGFDGHRFTPNEGPLVSDYGANFYAVQSYSGIPASDGRRIQIAWMNGGSYPGMPFNQQMSFPCALTLRRTGDGLRLYRWPVREIASLYDRGGTVRLRGRTVRPGANLPLGAHDLMDVEAEFEPRTSRAFGVRIGAQEIRYSVPDRKLTCLGRSAPLAPEAGRVRIRILADRTSMEVFGNGGRVSLTSCFLPAEPAGAVQVSAFAEGSPARLVSLALHPICSAWTEPANQTESQP